MKYPSDCMLSWQQVGMMLFLLAFVVPQSLLAQRPFQEAVFDSITVDTNVVYGNNISVQTGLFEAVDLLMDVYMPAEDASDMRSLVIVIPDGNLLPRIENKSPLGTRRDSVNVALCTRLARQGYVAASISHRLGWAASGSLENKRDTYAEALYRAIQDARTCVRFFKRQAVEAENRFGVDIEKIAIGGIGFGGFVATGAAYLDRPEEILLDKLSNANREPYIDPFFLGDFEARDSAVICRPNHSAYDSEFQMVFNIGGGILDSSWIDRGNMPTINFHTIGDPVIPYRTGFIRVPFSNDILFEVHGSRTLTEHAEQLGLQDTLFTAGFTDVFTERARSRNGGIEGLYPFIRPLPSQGEVYECEKPSGETLPRRAEHNPWSWWDEEAFIADWTEKLGTVPTTGPLANCNERAGNPDMSVEKGMTYLDTIINYLNPRFLRSFGFITKRSPKLLSAQQLSLYPNPARESIQLVLSDSPFPIKRISLHDAYGKEVLSQENLQRFEYRLKLPAQLSPGIYFLSIHTQEAQTVRKIMLE